MTGLFEQPNGARAERVRGGGVFRRPGAAVTAVAVMRVVAAVIIAAALAVATPGAAAPVAIPPHGATGQAAGRSGEAASARPGWMAYEEFSPNLIRAVLVAEDVNFFTHEGFEHEPWLQPGGRADEAWERPGAGPTISQQLTRMLWPQRNGDPHRWVRLTLLTSRLERLLDKHEILALYLNLAKFGPRLYGADAAARHYFGVSAAQLSPEQAARLVCLLPAPGRWRPDCASRSYRGRVTRTLARMESEVPPGAWQTAATLAGAVGSQRPPVER